MANNTYITEALEKLNKMPRMSDSKKSLKESSRRGLTEAEMSPEDAEDTQVLRNIQDKMKRRPSSARLNRKELAVLDKYGLYYDKDSALLRYSESEAPFYGIGNLRGSLRRDMRKINLADSARKHQDRLLARRGTDSDVFDARKRYHDMDVALDYRDWAKQELDRLDDKNYTPNKFVYYQGPQTADSLAKDIDMIKSGREYDRNHAQDELNRSQKEINKILRRDESFKESKNLKESTTRDARIAADDIAEELDRVLSAKFGDSVDIVEDPNTGMIKVSADGVDTLWTVSTRLVYQYVLAEASLGEMNVSGEAGSRDEFVGDSVKTIALNYR